MAYNNRYYGVKVKIEVLPPTLVILIALQLGCQPSSNALVESTTQSRVPSLAKNPEPDRQETFKMIKRLRKEGRAAIRTQQYSVAEEKLLAARQLEPNGHQARLELASLYRVWGKQSLEYAELRAVALAKLPGSEGGRTISSAQQQASLYTRCASLAHAMGDTQAELTILKRGWSMCPKQVAGFPSIPNPSLTSASELRLAMKLIEGMRASISTGDEDALSIFEDVIRTDGRLGVAWISAAIVARSLGKQALAIQYCKMAQKAEKSSDEVTAQAKSILADLQPQTTGT